MTRGPRLSFEISSIGVEDAGRFAGYWPPEATERSRRVETEPVCYEAVLEKVARGKKQTTE